MPPSAFCSGWRDPSARDSRVLAWTVSRVLIARGRAIARGARLVLLVAVAACDSADEPGSRALDELERLTFVPPADCLLPPNSDLSLRRAIVFDRFEFTRADLRHYWPTRRSRAETIQWHTDAALDAPERADWPAALDYFEASELAALRGMRLPTAIEWLHVAVGRKDYQKPWGGSGREFFANTVVIQGGEDFSLKSPCGVGTFENGKSQPFGCYDLLGNAWEWVDGIVYGCVSSREPGADERDELDDLAGTVTCVMGGAYDTRWRPTYELDRSINRQRFHARREDKRTLGPSFGARMCADAEPYLWSQAPRWGSGAAARARVHDVGQRWAQGDALARATLRELLTRMRKRPGAPEALAWLEEGGLAEP